MSVYKEIEETAAACRIAQLMIEECEEAAKQFEKNAIIRAKTFGMISAAIDAMVSARINLKFCADRLYKSLDEMQVGEEK